MAPTSDIMEELYNIHNKIALRDNASLGAIINTAAAGGKDFFTSLAAGLLTLGETHAPLMQTYDFLMLHNSHKEFNPEDFVKKAQDSYLSLGKRVPGWGSGFVKDKPDPMFEKLDDMLQSHDIHTVGGRITEYLHMMGYNIYPNASYYTIASCLATNTPIQSAPYHLVNARLHSWYEAWHNTYSNKLR